MTNTYFSILKKPKQNLTETAVIPPHKSKNTAQERRFFIK